MPINNLLGLFILSVSTSKISLIILPPAAIKSMESVSKINSVVVNAVVIW